MTPPRYLPFFSPPPAPPAPYTLSLHDALPISALRRDRRPVRRRPVRLRPLPRRGVRLRRRRPPRALRGSAARDGAADPRRDRKSTRLNSSHRTISYAVFCLKKKKNKSKTVVYQ